MVVAEMALRVGEVLANLTAELPYEQARADAAAC